MAGEKTRIFSGDRSRSEAFAAAEGPPSIRTQGIGRRTGPEARKRADHRSQDSRTDMNYQSIFEGAIDQLKAEKRYRVFADLERIVGRFPHAIWRKDDQAHEIVVWCSDD